MESFKSALQILFYLVWIVMGVLLIVVVFNMIVNNPFSKLSSSLDKVPAQGQIPTMPNFGNQGQQQGGQQPGGQLPASPPAGGQLPQNSPQPK